MKLNHSLKRIVSLLLGLAMVLSLAACKGETTTQTPAAAPTSDAPEPESTPTNVSVEVEDKKEDVKYAEKITIASASSVASMDPGAVNTVFAKSVYMLTHDTLVRSTSNGIVGRLAETYEVEGGKTFTFHLVQNATFHNGEPVTADDVLASFERCKDGKYTKSAYANIESIEKVDEHTVKLVLVAPNNDFLYTLADPLYSVLSKKALEEQGPDEGAKMGSGPYMTTNFSLNEEIVLERYEQYWGGVKPTKTLCFRYMSEAASRAIALESYEIDLALDIANADLVRIQEDSKLKSVDYDTTMCMYLALNTQKAPFNDVKVRQAIAKAINKSNFVAALNGAGSEANLLWGKTQFGRNNDLTGYEYDVEGAKALMAEAGVSGFDMEITAYSSMAMLITLIQYDLKQIGINVIANGLDTAGTATYLNTNDYDAYLAAYYLSGYGDSGRGLIYTGAGSNRAKFSNTELDTLMDDARAEQDDAKRASMYGRVQEILVEESPYVPIYHGKSFVGFGANLGGFVLASSGAHAYEDIYCIVE